LIDVILLKARELVNRIRDTKEERGQSSAEYVAVTAVAVSIAIGAIYLFLETSLTNAVSDIAAAVTSFVSSAL